MNRWIRIVGPFNLFWIGIPVLFLTAIFLFVYYPTRLPDILFGSIHALVSIAILCYWFSQSPKPMLMWVCIEPEDEEQKIVADEDFLIPVQGSDRPTVEPKRLSTYKEIVFITLILVTCGFFILSLVLVPLFFVIVIPLLIVSAVWTIIYRLRLKITCREVPSKLRITFDIANEGHRGITVHEVFYKLLKPQVKSGYVIPLVDKEGERRYLRGHERVTEGFRFPWDGNTNLNPGHYKFGIRLYTTERADWQDIDVQISEDMRTIVWW
jgi:hypothetical protein